MRIFAIAFLYGTMAATAAQVYPSRPIRIVVASAPSSGPDVVARLVGRRLTDAWGQQIVVDDRAGAGGNLGAEIASRAAPDGYTLLVATGSHAIGATLYSKLNYDLIKDFSAVTLLATTPYILVVNNSMPVTSVKEFIALAKAKPGALSYGSGGSGSPPHLCAEILKSMAGIDFVHVPYKSIAPALVDLAGGQIQALFAVVPAALPLIRAGKVRGLAVSGAKRTPLAPDLPTVAESVPGFEVIGWYGFVVPKGTPEAIVAKLNAESLHALKIPELREQLSAAGADTVGTTPQEFAAFMRAEIKKFGKAIKDSGARAE
jgi:tripartite-type tricarboxylate transporter receptor subunit TctC